MKAIKNIPIFLLTMMLCLGIMTIPVFAASSMQDGLEVTLTTDKKTYSRGDQIVATLTVTNKNDVGVSNVTLENLIPDGYKLVGDSMATKQVESLAMGEKVSLTVTYVAEDSNDNGNKPSNGTDTDDTNKPSNGANTDDTNGPETGNNSGNGTHTPHTGDDNNIALWCVMTIVAGVVVFGVLKKKVCKKILSLFLYMTIVGTMVIGISVPAKAGNFKSKSISVSENIRVGNTDLVISASVKYDVDTDQVDEPTKPTKPENPSAADEYYWNNSEVVKVIDAKESNDVPNETEVVSTLKERGFVDYPITYEYSIEGKYNDETEVLEGSTTKHPMYQTYYVTQNGDVWTIFVINGAIFANPASFNLESELEAQLLFAENKELTSYDDETNKFYVTIPKESAAIVKVAEKIDAETLDKLTIEEIKNYEK